MLTPDPRPAFARAMAAQVARRLLPAAVPFYDPAKVAEPAGLAQALHPYPQAA